MLYVERGGKTLLSWTSDPAVLGPAAAALAGAARGGALGRLTIERADGSAVQDSPLAQALEEAGFRPTPRGLAAARASGVIPRPRGGVIPRQVAACPRRPWR